MTARHTFLQRSRLGRLLGPSMIVYAGGIARAALAFVMNTIVARWFSPDEFGIYYSFIVVTIIVHSFVGEGLDPAVVRSYAHRAANDPAKKSAVVGSALVLRIAIAVPLLLATIIWSDWAAAIIFGDARFAPALFLGAAVGFVTALMSLALSVLQGREEFRMRAALTPLLNLLRVLLVPALIVSGLFFLPTIFWSHVILAFGCCLIGFWTIRSELADMTVTREQVSELFHVSKWSSVVYFSYFIYCYMGIPALSHFHGTTESGLFAAAASLMMVIETGIAAVTAVQLPAVSKLTGLHAFRNYILRSAPVFAAIAAGLLPIILAASYIITLVYGDEYQDSAAALRILVVGGLVHLIAAPMSTVFYGIKRTDLFALTQVVSMVAWIALALLLIPPYSILGAATATLIARLLSSVLIFFVLWRVLNAAKPSEINPA